MGVIERISELLGMGVIGWDERDCPNGCDRVGSMPLSEWVLSSVVKALVRMGVIEWISELLGMGVIGWDQRACPNVCDRV
ncbi:unnamed protein product [Toxocara canis]|uniref:Uncharacterized protein n=1 Tax=Toxocara canis TaxID=6265 RepID=A0A183U2S8_TOXCA|nr:unnamed protein product [Toxocara canis]